MPTVRGSFDVEAPAEVAFRATLALESWPELNPSCREVTIVEEEGMKCRFRMVHDAGEAWESDMWRSADGLFAFSERHDPPAPITVMQYLRVYRDLGGGRSTVTEIVNFELAEENAEEADSIRQRMRRHMDEIHPSIQAHVESTARAESGP